MKKKPLKISWRAWCINKLALRDYSSFEIKQLILKRAAESDQEVDAASVVNQLVEEGLIDDTRYIKSQISMSVNGYRMKGPREIRYQLEKKGGITPAMLDDFIQDEDQQWFDLAVQARNRALATKGIDTSQSLEIPLKIYQNLKQTLYRKGFTKEQIHHATSLLSPQKEEQVKPAMGNLENMIHKLAASGKGPRAILYQLKQKGFDESKVNSLLDSEDPSWITVAEDLLKKQFNRGKRLTMKERKKQSDYLARRGFLSHQIRTAIENVCSS